MNEYIAEVAGGGAMSAIKTPNLAAAIHRVVYRNILVLNPVSVPPVYFARTASLASR